MFQLYVRREKKNRPNDVTRNRIELLYVAVADSTQNGPSFQYFADSAQISFGQLTAQHEQSSTGQKNVL